MITKVLSQFYIVTDQYPPFVLCDTAKAIHISDKFDLFVHHKEVGWSVSEGMSGREVCGAGTRPAAIKEATRILTNVTERYMSKAIAQNINKTGLSPRYKLGDGLTIEQVTDIMCLTGETSQEKPKENKVARTKTNKTEQAQELRAQASTEIATVPDPQPATGQLDIVPDANIMTAEDALRIEANMEKSMSNWYKYVMQLYRGRAYITRGFPNWESYYADVTGKSRASSYRAVDEAIQKEKLIEMGVPAKFNQKQIAALKPIIEKGKDAIEKVLKDAKNIVTDKGANEKVKSEFHNTGMLPASAIKKAVEKIVPPAVVAANGLEVNVEIKNQPVDITPGSPADGVSDRIPNTGSPLTAQEKLDDQAQIDTETSDRPVDNANPVSGGNGYLLHFAACAWHTDPVNDIPTGCLKVETREGGYVLVPYSAVYDAVNTWPQEFITEQGEYAPPED